VSTPHPNRYAHAALVALITLFAASSAIAAGTTTSAGTYGAPFLRIPVGARLMSAPDVIVGMQPDASLVFSNPAFMTSVPRTELFATTSNWLDEMRFSAVSVAVPVGRSGTVVALGSNLLYSGQLQGYDGALNVITEDSYYDFGLTGAIGHRFGNLSVGLATTYIRQHVFPANANGYAVSMGASYWLGRNFFHASANDFAGRVTFDSRGYAVDGRYSVGYGRLLEVGPGEIYAGGQMVFADASEDRLQLGVDYHFNGMFSIRASSPDALGNAVVGPLLAGGLGVRYGSMQVEYAYTPQEYFSSAHTFSVVFSLGGGGEPHGGGPADRGYAVAEDAAPVISESQIQGTPDDAVPPDTSTAPFVPVVVPEATSAGPAASQQYLIVAGTHAWLNSARSEAQALELLHVLTEIEPLPGGRYRVVIGRFTDLSTAKAALARFAQQGHRFSIVSETAGK
jgi:hypothetical protein